MLKRLLGGAVAMIAASMGGAGDASAVEVGDVFKYKVGAIEVSLLSEGQSEGKTAVLTSPVPGALEKYAPGGTFATAVNTFLVKLPGRTILIDTGFGRKLFDNMASLGVKPEQVDAVLLTHMHGDHIGGLLRDGKPAFPKAELYVAKQEAEYWNSDKEMNARPEDRRESFVNARKALQAYRERLHEFEPGPLGESKSRLAEGITAVAAFGHTPGHTMYLIESEGKELLIWADLAHAMQVQMPVPSVATTYDSNPRQAVETREKVLAFVAAKKLPITGMHVPAPAVGNVSAGPDGGYVFQPTKMD